ncbi:MAG: hypothetical protein IT580_16685 [Verrucomicrobiales bacterium]|nr:hypothetical protein [Verrucomicrobiales bacterium]
MRPTPEELRDLWLFAYARTSLLEAIDWIYLMDSAPSGSHSVDALLAAVVVAYGRPFTKSQLTRSVRKPALQDVAAPAHLQSTHDVLLILRDKVIGHKDATIPDKHSGTPNMLFVRKEGNDFELSTVVVTELRPEARKEAMLLCKHFVQYCEEQCRRFLERYGPELGKMSSGVYRVQIDDASPDWITPHPAA